MVVEDFSDVKDGDFELISEGKYPIVIDNSVIDDSKSTPGNKTWKLEMTINDGKFKGRKLWFYMGMSKKAAPFRKGTLTALGVDVSGKVHLVDDVIGCMALAEVVHEEYQGEARAKVKRLRTPSEKKDNQGSMGDELETNLPF